jgi:hypothetical protein
VFHKLEAQKGLRVNKAFKEKLVLKDLKDFKG